MDISELYKLYLQHSSVETDSRKIKKDDLFFALKGPNHNGNIYAKAALEAGATYCIIDENPGIEDERLIRVDDALSTLQQLAKKHREQFTIPFIAITGSNGKTTTKELIHAVLSSQYHTYTTSGNLNNHIGIPLTILKIKKDAEFAVVEMGANHLKEIAGYCEYVMPTHGIITNCGKAHLEGFGSEAGVKKAKGELFDYLRENNGCAFVNWDLDYLRAMSKGIAKIITYGSGELPVDYEGRLAEQSNLISVQLLNVNNATPINTQLVGDYNLPNVLAATAVGAAFQVPHEKIRQALENYNPSNSRSQLIKKGSNSIILDAYNANPSSMKSAVENFAAMPGSKKILILGGMMELGKYSQSEHSQLVKHICNYQWENVALVGKNFTELPRGFLHFSNATELKKWFDQQDFNDAQILIKGSRSMEMEKVLD